MRGKRGKSSKTKMKDLYIGVYLKVHCIAYQCWERDYKEISKKKMTSIDLHGNRNEEEQRDSRRQT